MSRMHDEALEAADRIADLQKEDRDLYADLGRRLRELDPVVISTLARGSSDHAATYASYLIPLCLGKVVASLPPSLHTVLNTELNLRGQFTLAISQSGLSPDLVGSIRNCRAGGALTAAIVNHTDSPVAENVDFALPQRAGLETSVAATKTVLCTMAAIARLVGEWAQDRKLLDHLAALPDVLREAARVSAQIDVHALRGKRSAFVLSRALGEGAAKEVALKLKETCGLHAEGFSTAEVRHGPREIVDHQFLVVGLALEGSGESDVDNAVLELRAQGADVLLFGSRKEHAKIQDSGATYIQIPEIGDFRLLPIVALQLLYPWLARVAVALGRNPDQPRHLKSKIVKTL